MVAHRTAPTDTVCTDCGKTAEEGATFRRWRKTCQRCERLGYQARRRPPTPLPRDDDPPGAPNSPVSYMRGVLGPCPSSEKDLAGAKAYWAALARVCFVTGLTEQGELWQHLAETGGREWR